MIFLLFMQIEYQAVHRTYSDSVQELAVYLTIPGQKLHYFAEDTSFIGDYEIQLTVFDKDENQLTGDYWRRMVTEDTANIQDSVKLFIPENSEYYLLKIIDLHAGEIFTAAQRIIQVKNLGNMYWSIDNDTLKFTFGVFNQQGNIDSIIATIGGLVKTISVKRGVYSDSLIFHIADLSIDEYALKLDLYSEQGKIDELIIPIKVTRPFYMDNEMWALRVDQLQYIATPREMDVLEETEVSDRDSLWHEFWDKLDPTPNTEYNEKEIEYFERIAYAEQHFRNGDRGWRSDRARIFVKYGPPDEIQSYPYEIDTFPYEVWWYYKNNLQFVFVDRYGFGQYLLINPTGIGL
ncbi:GWxTD domain-containing protein [candidate division WOR-3 bacterium]|nr:GWxTD domain-containing protein [candidate division WOR-3 bacterium]